MLEKAAGLSPDAYMPDLEDSVPWEEKANARQVTSSFLPRLSGAGARVIPRLNSLESGLLEDDLAAVVCPHIFGVCVGKISSAADVERVSSALMGFERRAGLAEGAVRLVALLETALAIVKAHETCSASPRIVGVAFGADDYTSDMGIKRTESQSEIEYPRIVICVAARAAGVLALDTPYVKLRDPEGLAADVLKARGYGFRGKLAIHPEQIDIINETFSPTSEEVEHARRVVETFEAAQQAGRASTSLEGVMIDVPAAKRARQLLDLAEAISKRKPPGG